MFLYFLGNDTTGVRHAYMVNPAGPQFLYGIHVQFYQGKIRTNSQFVLQEGVLAREYQV